MSYMINNVRPPQQARYAPGYGEPVAQDWSESTLSSWWLDGPASRHESLYSLNVIPKPHPFDSRRDTRPGMASQSRRTSQSSQH